MIKKEEDEFSNEELKMETIRQLYEMFGGLRVLLQVAGVQMLN